ncbi:MAG TPA: flagellar motor switch protein FliM [Defluviitaleaceae bacterium]|nr:flagellar motor switch protein FliM [Defluviitaleaceae bacterium]HPT75237.1 flagellar motor switch protein FliM [Defluviitaleaceae bacterium]HQD51122.1 flagellar motor switch protein FliM [Defluviitaleaceae bacterium]
MGEVLSQSEIDELLKALNTGEIDVTEIQESKQEKHIKKYDFARPSKFAKEQLRTLEIIFDNYSRIISTYLSGYLRTPTQVDVINAEAVTYYEFSNSLSNPVILSIVDFSPLKGSIVIDLSPNLGYSIIDRILGGRGAMIDKIREFTEIERILLERIVTQLIALLKEPWENVVDLNPKLEKIETNSQFAQIISPNEMIALVTLNIKLGEVEGMMNICIPHLVLEPVLERLNTKYWFAVVEQEDKSAYRKFLEKRLEIAKIPIRAVLGKTHITVEEFIHLQVGDVIKLDSYINSDLEIYAGNLLKFYGKPGIHRKQNAVQITAVERREEI